MAISNASHDSSGSPQNKKTVSYNANWEGPSKILITARGD